MLDQCHNIEAKIPGQIRSVLNVQEMTARALLVDQTALERGAERSGDVLRANEVLMDAFYTDVRPHLAAWRESRGLPADPGAAYARSGYAAMIANERATGPSRLGRLTPRREETRGRDRRSDASR
jgi:L-rhamnose isomerase/sugar isomerase